MDRVAQAQATHTRIVSAALHAATHGRNQVNTGATMPHYVSADVSWGS